jgi:hypothetical protein
MVTFDIGPRVTFEQQRRATERIMIPGFLMSLRGKIAVLTKDGEFLRSGNDLAEAQPSGDERFYSIPRSEAYIRCLIASNLIPQALLEIGEGADA